MGRFQKIAEGLKKLAAPDPSSDPFIDEVLTSLIEDFDWKVPGDRADFDPWSMYLTKSVWGKPGKILLRDKLGNANISVGGRLGKRTQSYVYDENVDDDAQLPLVAQTAAQDINEIAFELQNGKAKALKDLKAKEDLKLQKQKEENSKIDKELVSDPSAEQEKPKVQKGKTRAVSDSFLEQVRASLLNDHGWDAGDRFDAQDINLFKRINGKLGKILLTNKKGFAKVSIDGIIKDRTYLYVYEENPEDLIESADKAAQELDSAASRLTSNKASDLKQLKAQEKSKIQQAKEEKAQEDQLDKESTEVDKTVETYRNKLQKSRVQEIKDILLADEWKKSIVFGINRYVGGNHFRLYFASDHVRMSSEIMAKDIEILFEDKGPKQIVKDIYILLRGAVEDHTQSRKVPQKTEDGEIVDFLKSGSWKITEVTEDRIVRAVKAVDGSPFGSQITITFDLNRNYLNFSYQQKGEQAPVIQLHSIKLEKAKTSKTKEMLRSAIDSAVLAANELDDKRVEKIKQQELGQEQLRKEQLAVQEKLQKEKEERARARSEKLRSKNPT